MVQVHRLKCRPIQGEKTRKGASERESFSGKAISNISEYGGSHKFPLIHR